MCILSNTRLILFSTYVLTLLILNTFHKLISTLVWQHNLHYGAPEQQLWMMFDPVRLYATAIYVGCAVLALILALWVCNIWSILVSLTALFSLGSAFGLTVQIQGKLLMFIPIICEICALLWYPIPIIMLVTYSTSLLLMLIANMGQHIECYPSESLMIVPRAANF